ncbi:MaoC family dehydratase [Brevibacterium sp. UCMA 11754]|uniref:MaoC family dehydratase n=1 Tax=Brevibacterium sp. UCMA 11754 TaxID=2749198 RepID=UPI001F1E9B18|nr:MaoC family dehydratase [Brevibacterium sp. UCMA 11754]MCF2572734.1 MaoC family dehydratase [Brevibacterium sp. UCMA 11754]
MTTHDAIIGRFFEDYIVGDEYQHPFGRTITDADNVWLTNLTMNTNQNHFNEHFAAQNPITDGKVIVNSGLTVALVLGLTVYDMSQNAISNLAFTDIMFRHPVYVGDTLYAESVCTEARRSKSREYAGIISMTTRGLNQEGTTVVTWKRSVMVATKESGIGQDYFPKSTDAVTDYS